MSILKLPLINQGLNQSAFHVLHARDLWCGLGKVLGILHSLQTDVLIVNYHRAEKLLALGLIYTFQFNPGI